MSKVNEKVNEVVISVIRKGITEFFKGMYKYTYVSGASIVIGMILILLGYSKFALIVPFGFGTVILIVAIIIGFIKGISEAIKMYKSIDDDDKRNKSAQKVLHTQKVKARV
ncbi:hypothetical protein NSS82_19205 [Paenibacillus sp. FSL H7-0735]|uniref:hypothetical protein n=1 Tax=Paenibacillus sp. FSL H7-0735 TaxID=2954736 RepID=UPI0030FA20E2